MLGKIREAKRFLWDGEIDYKVEYNQKSYIVMKNAIIATKFANPAPIVDGQKIIWITNSNISAKFYCNDNHTSFVKVHNLSSLCPQDCEIHVNSPFLLIKLIPNILI